MIRRHPVLWAWLLATVPLLGWWTYGLFDLDEGFYAAVASEMNRRGEWITPLYNGKPWFEKPILLYWLAKPSLLLFGDEIGPRLPSILAMMATYGVVGWFANRRMGASAAVLSVIALASSLLAVGVGRMMLTDPLLLLCLTGAFCTFWESLAGDARWRLATAACLGFGVLAKGPIAGILFVPVAGFTYWRQPTLRVKFRGYWLGGVAIFLVVVASWYLPAYLEDGHVFVQKFLIEQNVGRFTGGDQAHTLHGIAGLVFYAPIVLLGFAPWSFLLPRVWKPTLTPDEAGLRSYLTTWFVTVFVFFTVAGAKLPSYVLPLAPAVAMLVGGDLCRRWSGALSPKRLAAPVAWLLGVAVLAQWAFSSYYYGIKIASFETPGFHAEVHRIARYVHDNANPTDIVVEYRLGRQQANLGTGKLKIQETTHPSTLLYLDRDVMESDDWNRILALPGPAWIITRWNRVSALDSAAAGRRLVQVATPFNQDLYRLYLLQRVYKP